MPSFVSILANETTGISCMAQFSSVYRYTFNGSVIERFVCFNDVSENKTASATSSLILKHIKNFANCAKLADHTYDGAAATVCLLHLAECKAKLKMFIRKLFLYTATLMS